MFICMDREVFVCEKVKGSGEYQWSNTDFGCGSLLMGCSGREIKFEVVVVEDEPRG